MEKKLLNIGYISCLLMVSIQIFEACSELTRLKVLFLKQFIFGLDYIINILILVILWRVLVKIFKQIQLDFILKVIIIILIILTPLSVFQKFIHLGHFTIISIIILTIIDFIFYFIFINRLVQIDKSEILQIEQLKNYAVAFVICLFGMFILSIVLEFSRIKNLNYMSHFLILIPYIFIGLFFLRTKHEIR